MSLYWTGNAAKAKIVNEILETYKDKECLIFDYGCGTAGDWPHVLKDHPHIQWVGYEPFEGSYQKAKTALSGLPANIYTGSELDTLSFQADAIVSFSVFEHVLKPQQYLQNAKKHLKPGGSFYLNYDDGHFRKLIDLDERENWIRDVKEWISGSLVDVRVKLGRVHEGNYKKRVIRKEVDQLVAEQGFKVKSSFYSNLLSFKGLSKTLPEDKKEDFLKLWLSIEDQLNQNFLTDGPLEKGDTANLWRFSGSRTLQLTH